MKKHKDTKEIESTMMRISRAQRAMELSKRDRKNLLKSVSQQKPSEAFMEWYNKKITGKWFVLSVIQACVWMDKHCELKVKHGK